MAVELCFEGWKMNKRIKSIWDQAAKTHSGDSWEELTAFMEAYAQLVASDCIATIQLHMPRNGVKSPENVISRTHINNIADLYGITLPLPNTVYERQINDILAGADAMSDKGYQVGTKEGYDTFVSKRNAGS